MAQEIDAVTIPELPDGILGANSLLTFAGADGKMYKTTAQSVAGLFGGSSSDQTPSDETFLII